MDHKTVEKYVLSLPNTRLDYPFGEDVAVYKFGGKRTLRQAQGKEAESGKHGDDGKMFALIAEKSDPLRISLKCDPVLAETLREKYETVMPGYHLSKKHWNTIVLSGQLDWEELKPLIRHSYDLVTKSGAEMPEY